MLSRKDISLSCNYRYSAFPFTAKPVITNPEPWDDVCKMHPLSGLGLEVWFCVLCYFM